MGKGDRKTRRGKIWRGTYGKSRPRKLRNKLASRYPQLGKTDSEKQES